MRKVWKLVAGWLHATLVLSLLTPVCYCFGFNHQDSDYLFLYLRCWLLIIPLIVSWRLIHVCKGLGTYLFSSGVLVIGMGILYHLVGPYWAKSTFYVGYVCIMIAETILIVVLRYYDRLYDDQRNVKSDRYDPGTDDDIRVLNEPALPHLAWFGIVYGIGLFRKQPVLCNIVMYSVIAYMIIYLLFQYLKRTEHYLKLNNRVSNLPGRRLYGITGGVMAAIIAVVLLMIIPTVASTPYRRYWTGEEWNTGYMLAVTVTPEEEQKQQETESEYDPRTDLDFGHKVVLPQAVKAMIYVFAGILLFGFVLCILRQIRENFKDFRKSFDENGDEVEELEDVSEPIEKAPMKHVRRRNETKREQIRREYRKTIRRNRKDLPKPGETPTEIEAAAGLLEDADMKVLHEEYENARYTEDE